MRIKLEKRKDTTGKVQKESSVTYVPAVIYGPKRESGSVKVDVRLFEKVFAHAGYSNIIECEIEGEKDPVKALIREVQRDPVTDMVVHVSLYELDLTKQITAEIPLITKGVSQAVKDNIGFLVTPLDTVEVRCLPDKLPSKIEVDINVLKKIGDSISVRDLKLPEGVEFTGEAHETITVAYIAPPQKEIVEEEVVEEVEEKEAEEGKETEEEKEGEDEKGKVEGAGEAGEGEEKQAPAASE